MLDEVILILIHVPVYNVLLIYIFFTLTNDLIYFYLLEAKNLYLRWWIWGLIHSSKVGITCVD